LIRISHKFLSSTLLYCEETKLEDIVDISSRRFSIISLYLLIYSMSF
jgi:hypothetical protein